MILPLINFHAKREISAKKIRKNAKRLLQSLALTVRIAAFSRIRKPALITCLAYHFLHLQDLRKTAPARLQRLALLFVLPSPLGLVGTILRKSYFNVTRRAILSRIKEVICTNHYDVCADDLRAAQSRFASNWQSAPATTLS